MHNVSFEGLNQTVNCVFLSVLKTWKLSYERFTTGQNKPRFVFVATVTCVPFSIFGHWIVIRRQLFRYFRGLFYSPLFVIPATTSARKINYQICVSLGCASCATALPNS